MNSKEILGVLSANSNKKYEYFIKKVVDFEEIWGLYDDGWASVEDNEGNPSFPIWPKKEFAELYTKDGWESYEASSIDLYDFLELWIPGMKKNGYGVSIFWDNGSSIKVSLDKLVEDLNEELENY